MTDTMQNELRRYTTLSKEIIDAEVLKNERLRKALMNIMDESESLKIRDMAYAALMGN